jgi:hypothetical protein|nr:hypothetical protein [Kofleriaceae bacterium]
MEVRFAEHAKFHRAAIGMVGGSAVLGLALSPLTASAPVVAGLGGIALGATLAHGRPLWRFVPAVAGGAAVIALAHRDLSTSALAPIVAGLAIAFGVGLATGVRGVRGAIAHGLGAVVGLLAMWTALRFDHARALHAWPTPLVSALSATAMGIVGVLAMLPRHLSIATDPVLAALRRLPAGLPAEVTDLCQRSVKVWASAKRELAADDHGRELVRDGVLKTLDVAAKTAGGADASARDADLATRMTDLDARIAAATDAEVKTQYEAARAALADQARYRETIKNGRERLVARMHNHVAAIEKFQLAATTLPAAKHDDLESDITLAGEAMAELTA